MENEIEYSTLQRIKDFLYYEASLIDNRQFNEWEELLAEDIHYWVPIRRTLSRNDMDNEFTDKTSNSFFDENKEELIRRLRKLETGFSWSEDPPSRTRHFLSNIRIQPGRTHSEY